MDLGARGKNGSVYMDSKTVMFGVFGDPIAHSRSPLMMNRAFAECGLNAAYAAFHIRPGTLRQAVEGMKALGYRGANVTIPYKVEVMAYLDEIDEGAQAIGAVNTIVHDEGRLKGYNTDGIGYVRSLVEETGIGLSGAKIVLIGAGGASRGIAYALAKSGAGLITIANRTKDKAVELADAMSLYTDTSGVGMDEVGGILAEADLVVNTTSVGMHPRVEELPIDPSLLREGVLVSDLIYNPRETALLQEARKRGARTHGGLGMFIYQGAYAFEYWTGQPAPVAAMREVVEQSLRNEG